MSETTERLSDALANRYRIERELLPIVVLNVFEELCRRLGEGGSR